MARKTRRVLSDADWQRIAPHLPAHPASPKGGRPRESDRQCLEGILWLLRTGARWRDIPVDMPSGSACWRRLQEWAGESILEGIGIAEYESVAEAEKRIAEYVRYYRFDRKHSSLGYITPL